MHIIIVILVALFFFSVLASIPPIVWIGLLIAIVVATVWIIKNRKDIHTLDFGNFFDYWEKEDLKSEETRIRLKRAKEQNIQVPEKAISPKLTVIGTTGKPYTTTLYSCTCPDFTRRKKPCKHILKLAIVLNQIGMQDDFYEIPEDVEDTISSLNAGAKEVMIKYLRYDLNEENIFVSRDKIMIDLVHSGLFVECDEPYLLLNKYYTKPELLTAIENTASTSKPRKDSRKEVLIQWLIENEPGVCKIMCQKYMILTVNPYIKPYAKDIIGKYKKEY